MHLERVVRLINLLDVPAKKRKFWPQYSVIVFDDDKNVLDVVQKFGSDPVELARAALKFYPKARAICAMPGWYETETDLEQRLSLHDETDPADRYVVGKGRGRTRPC